jgi:hypothetical protein
MTKIAVLLFVLLAADTVCATDDPFVGKWVLNVKASQYSAATRPKTMVIEMEAVGKGVRYRSDTTFENGRTAHSEYTADYNGNQAVVRGAHGMLLPVLLKRVDLYTVEASYTRDLIVVATSRRVVSRDGRRMTITTVSKDAKGKSVTTVGVYTRQAN